MRQTRKLTGKSGLNLSQNSFLISASQKVTVRLSFERVHDHQTEKDRSPAQVPTYYERYQSLPVSNRTYYRALRDGVASMRLGNGMPI